MSPHLNFTANQSKRPSSWLRRQIVRKRHRVLKRQNRRLSERRYSQHLGGGALPEYFVEPDVTLNPSGYHWIVLASAFVLATIGKFVGLQYMP